MVKSTKIIGVLNITPDSFSDGGKFNSKEAALRQLQKMLHDGADMIDIGAESTRPNHIRISQQEEWQRLEEILPEIIEAIKKFNHDFKCQVTSSIDSRNFITAKKSYEIGVDIINDVSGLVDENLVEFVAAKNITTILMHNLEVAAVENVVINKHINLSSEILHWAQNKIDYLVKKGVKKTQLIFDLGIGFGKNAMQSIRILKNIDDYKILALPLYIGHSRKSFLKAINFSQFGDLNVDEKTLIISQYLLNKNIDFIRVHDVAAHKKIFKDITRG